MGKELRTVKYGSNTFLKNLFAQKIVAIIKPIIKDKNELINISYNVVKVWLKKLFEFISNIIVFKILLGDENKNVLIIPK